MASGVRVMEKPVQLQQQQPQQHEVLKCPRCDSANTKFCYYNNYSLSQPRHFCKACKRYWTRGGTLRNVPVGGGCRKNKRVKRPITSTSHGSGSLDHHTNPNPNPNPNLDHLPSSTTSNGNNNHHLNPLFYGLLPQNPNYPRFDSRVSGVNETLVSGYDLLQPHMNASGLGFSSSGPGGSVMASTHHGQNSSSLAFSNYANMYGGGGSNCSSTSAPTTMASLLASSLNQQQRFMGFSAYDGSSSMVKDLKMEATTQNRMEWNNNNFHGQNNKDDDDQIEAVHHVSSDPNNSLLWDTTNGDGGGWLDPTNNNNIGSSVPSLI